jgi:hypothetical protein
MRSLTLDLSAHERGVAPPLLDRSLHVIEASEACPEIRRKPAHLRVRRPLFGLSTEHSTRGSDLAKCHRSNEFLRYRLWRRHQDLTVTEAEHRSPNDGE